MPLELNQVARPEQDARHRASLRRATQRDVLAVSHLIAMPSLHLRRRLVAAILLIATAGAMSPARGQEPPRPPQSSWIFQRSYYSHQPANEVQVDKKVVTQGPVSTRPQGAYVRGGYRRLRVGGNLRCQNDDYHYFYESWFQRGEQF